MRPELDRSTVAMFDLKQGEGGLVDLEFLLQAGVLELAAGHPPLLEQVQTPELIDALGEAGWFDANTVAALRAAHSELLDRALACTLDARPRLASHDATLESAREAIKTAWRQRLD
jgi:[glutamine synthetase] adenylyltransferase / [glutamine synthetase]-adenylyl-L-tyrosine phosphorylase